MFTDKKKCLKKSTELIQDIKDSGIIEKLENTTLSEHQKEQYLIKCLRDGNISEALKMIENNIVPQNSTDNSNENVYIEKVIVMNLLDEYRISLKLQRM